MRFTSNSARILSSRLVSVIEPPKTRVTNGTRTGSSGCTSSVMTDAPEEPRLVTSPYPISPPAPVISVTGLRMRNRGQSLDNVREPSPRLGVLGQQRAQVEGHVRGGILSDHRVDRRR